MPSRLKRYQQAQDIHFITFSCHQRLPYLAASESKNIVEQQLERTRARHGARIYAYVLMPEHVHLLINESFAVPLAMFLKSLKQETSRELKGDRRRFWLPRYYDFNVKTPETFTEKIQYIHRNPVKRGLVASPERYAWSSYNHYFTGQPGIVEIESEWLASKRDRALLRSHSSHETTAR